MGVARRLAVRSAPPAPGRARTHMRGDWKIWSLAALQKFEGAAERTAMRAEAGSADSDAATDARLRGARRPS